MEISRQSYEGWATINRFTPRIKKKAQIQGICNLRMDKNHSHVWYPKNVAV